jgi:hypothetical protein
MEFILLAALFIYLALVLAMFAGLVDSARRTADAFQAIAATYNLGAFIQLAEADMPEAVRKMTEQSRDLEKMAKS